MRDANRILDPKEEDGGWLARHGLRLIHRISRSDRSVSLFGVGNRRNFYHLTKDFEWGWDGAFFDTREEAEDHALKYLLVEAGR